MVNAAVLVFRPDFAQHFTTCSGKFLWKSEDFCLFSILKAVYEVADSVDGTELGGKRKRTLKKF